MGQKSWKVGMEGEGRSRPRGWKRILLAGAGTGWGAAEEEAKDFRRGLATHNQEVRL